MTDLDLSDAALIERLGALFDHDTPPVIPDPRFVAEQRRLFVDLLATPVLTVRQYWAGLIAAEIKPWENRSRKLPDKYVGARVWIHSSAKGSENAPLRPDGKPYDVPKHLQACGRVLALATLTGCHEAAGCCEPWGQPDCWHWGLANVRALPEPIPAKGALGFWKPPVGLAAEALGQLEAAAVHERFLAICIANGGTADDDLLAGHPLFPVPDFATLTPRRTP